MSDKTLIQGAPSNLPHLPLDDSLFRAQLGLPCAHLLLWSWAIEKSVDGLHSKWWWSEDEDDCRKRTVALGDSDAQTRCM